MKCLAIIIVSLISRFLVLSCRAIESPPYTVVQAESDFEIRLYRESSWMSATVQGTTSFENSTRRGFHRLYRYIHGANLNSSKLKMTAPVLTNIASSPPSSDRFTYSVKYFLSAKFEGNQPYPNPELNLQVDKWRTHCVAVRKFSGFAKDDNINKETEALFTSLDKHFTHTPMVKDYNNSYAIAQYNASLDLSPRLNEVWINVSDFPTDFCKT